MQQTTNLDIDTLTSPVDGSGRWCSVWLRPMNLCRWSAGFHCLWEKPPWRRTTPQWNTGWIFSWQCQWPSLELHWTEDYPSGGFWSNFAHIGCCQYGQPCPSLSESSQRPCIVGIAFAYNTPGGCIRLGPGKNAPRKHISSGLTAWAWKAYLMIELSPTFGKSGL
jgi:hypothetical protein